MEELNILTINNNGLIAILIIIAIYLIFTQLKNKNK